MSVAQVFDPAAEIQKLRDHLSSHEKPILMLFGAGTSCAVETKNGGALIPAVKALTADCHKSAKALKKPFPEAWDLIANSLPDGRRDIEEILSSVRGKLEAVLDGDTLAGLDRKQLSTLEDTIKKTIATKVIPDPAQMPKSLPHEAMARWLRSVQREVPVEIFSLNYDTLIERGLEAEWVPYFDGFIGGYKPFFSAASLIYPEQAPARRWVRLWKIHSSVCWQIEEKKGQRRLVRGPEQASGEMILPSLQKYDESRKQPYVAMLDRFRNLLTEREDVVLLTLGYSFSDQHINELVFESLDNNPGLHVFALCFEDPPDDGTLVKTAEAQRQLLVLGPTKAVVGGRKGGWKVADPKGSVKRLDGLFEVAGKQPDTGKLQLGDFNVFCQLLDSLAEQSNSG